MNLSGQMSPVLQRCDELSGLVRDNLPNCRTSWEHYAAGRWVFKVDSRVVHGANSGLSDEAFVQVVKSYAQRLHKWQETPA